MAIISRAVTPSAQPPQTTQAGRRGDNPRSGEQEIFPVWLGRRVHGSTEERLQTEFERYDISFETVGIGRKRQAEDAGIAHKLIAPRTPWHNGKVERSHRNDQRYFYDWEKFGDVKELNEKLIKQLKWSNNKVMRTLGGKSPLRLLKEKLAVV